MVMPLGASMLQSSAWDDVRGTLSTLGRASGGSGSNAVADGLARHYALGYLTRVVSLVPCHVISNMWIVSLAVVGQAARLMGRSDWVHGTKRRIDQEVALSASSLMELNFYQVGWYSPRSALIAQCYWRLVVRSVLATNRLSCRVSILCGRSASQVNLLHPTMMVRSSWAIARLAGRYLALVPPCVAIGVSCALGADGISQHLSGIIRKASKLVMCKFDLVRFRFAIAWAGAGSETVGRILRLPLEVAADVANHFV